MDQQTIEFIHTVTWAQLPEPVQQQARRCLLDTLGAAIGAYPTDLARLIRNFAAANYGGQGAHLWLDGREVSPPGAALANGMTIDALDIHDGHSLTKGHAGAAVVPAVLGTLRLGPTPPVSGQELLTALVVGYEIALRAGMALHATAADYHTSGAWNALGCAALTARRLGLSADQTRHALGIAEYHGPRSQMMRCIDYPTMVKDGSGWGAMAGVSAALLAGAGFTGAPAITVTASEVAAYWQDLGSTWHILGQYFKPHAVCRWAQPAVEGALVLKQQHGLRPSDIQHIRIATFHEAACLAVVSPHTTEEAQYSLPFAMAAALVHGGLGARALSGPGLVDEVVLELARRVELVEDATLSARFPRERLAHIQIDTCDGRQLELREAQPRWEAAAPPTDTELRDKFQWLATGVISTSRAAALEAAIWNCAAAPDAGPLMEWLAPAPTEQPVGEQT